MTFPQEIRGTPVCQVGGVCPYMGERWVQLAPTNSRDTRRWEFSLDSGMLLLTHL